MSEHDSNNQPASAPDGAAQSEQPQDSGEQAPSYRKAEEDSTALAETERTGEGTGARAGEYG